MVWLWRSKVGCAFWWFSKHQQYGTSGGVFFMVLTVSTCTFRWFLFDFKSSTPEIPMLLILTNQRLTFSPPSITSHSCHSSLSFPALQFGISRKFNVRITKFYSVSGPVKPKKQVLLYSQRDRELSNSVVFRCSCWSVAS